jgi:hypothetical protein
VDLNLITLKIDVKILVLRILYLCGAFDMKNKVKEISLINSDITLDTYDYITGIYKRAMNLRKTFHSEYRTIFDEFDAWKLR